MKKTIVVALGGNAFLQSNQKPSLAIEIQNIESALKPLVPLFRQKNELVLTHGNGPQVGNILTQIQSALKKAYSVPLEVAVAESQGEIGFLLEESLRNLLLRHRIRRLTVSMLTQVLVQKTDPAFQNPSKPIGPFLSKSKAKQLKQKGFAVMEDSGRGWRRIVASPKPVRTIEKKVIQNLTAHGMIVIAAGGGGIPVVKTKTGLKGVPAVIDKDWASAVLANEIHAQDLIILTGVKTVFLNFNSQGQKPIFKLTVSTAQNLLKQGQFAKGSMQPKIEAAIHFLKKGGKRVLITSPSILPAALKGKNGTWIVK